MEISAFSGNQCLWWRADMTVRERRRRRCLWREGDLTVTMKGRRRSNCERKKKKMRDNRLV